MYRSKITALSKSSFQTQCSVTPTFCDLPRTDVVQKMNSSAMWAAISWETTSSPGLARPGMACPWLTLHACATRIPRPWTAWLQQSGKSRWRRLDISSSAIAQLGPIKKCRTDNTWKPRFKECVISKYKCRANDVHFFSTVFVLKYRSVFPVGILHQSKAGIFQACSETWLSELG